MRKMYIKASMLGFVCLSSVSAFAQQEEKALDEVKVSVGSRNKKRVVTDSAVPIDVLDVSGLTTTAPQQNVTQLLNYAAPSFTSNTATVADGTDHIDPAQLRGLGPDQVLVLLNGKRRHTSSLVNVNGTTGRGSVGTDLNAIPAFAIERIEVLRDGAAAQYGSDAIAGVINVIMKRNTGKFSGAVTGGGFLSKNANNFDGGMDGKTIQVDLNYGTDLGKKGGYINLTGGYIIREETSRAGERTPTTSSLSDIDAADFISKNNILEYRAIQAGLKPTNGAFTAAQLNPFKTEVEQQFGLAAGSFDSTKASGITNATSLTNQELAYRGQKRSDYNMRVGQSSLASAQVYLNTLLPINDNLKVYSFGGYSYRNGESAGFYRLPNNGNALSAYTPNGFLPIIESTINDYSMAAGLKGKVVGFDFDLSNAYGNNTFKYGVNNSRNATMINSPELRSFDAGKLGFQQNTVNLDLTKNYDTILSGLNVAFGGEFRYEQFNMWAGELDSYANYDASGNITNVNTGKAPGVQVFPGFREDVNNDRRSAAGYLDLELDITKKLLVSGAVRYEHFSDFGNTINGKITSRYKITNNFSVRGAASTGFRAPSLHQLSFKSVSTQFVGGVASENGFFENDSELARTIGINKLKQETSKSLSLGFTAKVPSAKLSFTVDGYITKIDDRIILTDGFAKTGFDTATQAIFNNVGAETARFWVNGIDTETKGIDLVVSHTAKFGTDITLRSDLAGSIYQTERVGDIHTTDKINAAGYTNSAFFTEQSRVYLEEATPRIKANIANTLTIKKLDVFLRNAYFGEVTDPNATDLNGDGLSNVFEHPTFGGKLITDLSIGYQFLPSLKFTVGANNIFDIYPDENPGLTKPFTNTDGVVNGNAGLGRDLSNGNQFVYSRNVSQFGQNGRFLFARMNFSF